VFHLFTALIAFRIHLSDIRGAFLKPKHKASRLPVTTVISKQGGMYEEATFIDRIALLIRFRWVK
jgi:hypothetical protein